MYGVCTEMGGDGMYFTVDWSGGIFEALEHLHS